MGDAMRRMRGHEGSRGARVHWVGCAEGGRLVRATAIWVGEAAGRGGVGVLIALVQEPLDSKSGGSLPDWLTTGCSERRCTPPNRSVRPELAAGQHECLQLLAKRQLTCSTAGSSAGRLEKSPGAPPEVGDAEPRERPSSLLRVGFGDPVCGWVLHQRATG